MKNILLWLSYDFANSLFTAAVGTSLYFSQWVVIDKGFDDIWYGATFSAATILLLLTSPFWGAWSDQRGKRMPFIRGLSLAMIIAGFFLALVAPSSLPTFPKVVLALLLFFFIQYFFQLSLIFYNALLDKLSNEKNRGKISGLGKAADEIGWILGTALLLPFATGAITLFGEPGRAQVFLPATILFIITGLPLLIFFKEPVGAVPQEKINFQSVSRSAIDGLKQLVRQDKNVAIFLLAFSFISDAVLTAQLYFGVFINQIYHFSDPKKVQVLLMMSLFTILSAFILGRLGDRFGLKQMLIVSCLALVAVFAGVALFTSPYFVYFLAVFAGIGWGGFYATSRALLVKISPAPRLGEYFGFYATFQRFASIIGPLTWGAVTLIFRNSGIFKYQAAMFSMALLVVIGTLILKTVEEQKALKVV